MCVCLCVCIYICIYIYIHRGLYACTHTHTQRHTSVLDDGEYGSRAQIAMQCIARVVMLVALRFSIRMCTSFRGIRTCGRCEHWKKCTQPWGCMLQQRCSLCTSNMASGSLHINTYIQIRQTDRQRQAGRQADRHTYIHAHMHAYMHTYIHTYNCTHVHTRMSHSMHSFWQ